MGVPLSQTEPESPPFRSIEAIAALVTEGIYRLVYTAVQEAGAGNPIETEAGLEAQAELHAYLIAFMDRISLGDLNKDAPERAIKVWIEEITPPDKRTMIGDVIVRGVKTFDEAIEQVSSRFQDSLSTKYNFHPEEVDI